MSSQSEQIIVVCAYVHHVYYDCDFKIEFELMTLHLKGEIIVYIVLTNELMKESVSTQSDAS